MTSPADAACAPQSIAGRYKVLGELGSGGAGTVYRVLDTRAGTQVALKCARRDLADARLSARFQHEYYTLTQLAHPRIVSVYDYGICELGLYYTMELLDGLDVREAAPLPPAEVCRLLRDVASALAVLHARRLLHRDISYRNVRCTASGHAKLLDFGAMMAIGSTTEVIGTRPFIPPESVQRGELDARSDLYSLGALAYWMLTARHAYPASSLISLQQLWALPSPPPPSALAEGVSPELDRLVMSLMSLQPQGRPASAAEVMDRLSAIGNLPPAEDLRVAEAYLTRPVLVGRERELKRIREYFTAQAAWRGPLSIEGSQGLGKTRLLEELLMEAKLAGAVTVGAAGSQTSTERYAVMREIVKQLVGQLPAQLSEVSDADRAILACEFPEFHGGATPANEVIPAGELRHRLQDALTRWLRQAARGARLMIVVDDFHLVDEHSAGVLAALAADRTEGNVRLAVGVLEQQAAATAAVRLLRQFAIKIPLRRLRQVDVAQLIGGIFGDVPNAGRVAHWLYGRTRGNPLECMELARYLVERELVHYAEGTWMLPAALPETLPLGLQETRTARVAALPPTQRCLAEALAVFGSPAPLSVCAELAEIDESTAQHCLQALVRLELITLQVEDYAYHSESLRDAIDSSVSPERSAALHEKAGQLLQRRAERDLRTIARAAQHLMRGHSRRQGADMVAAIARDPNVGRDVGEFFTTPLELALAIYREQQLGPAHTAHLLARLLIAAFMYDRDLVHHADALLPQLKFDAGFDLSVDRTQPDWLASVLALARERYATLPVTQRGLPPEEAVAMLSSVAGAVLAAAILKWDSRLIEAVWDVVEPLARLGSGAALSVAPELVGFYVDALRVGEACNHEQRMAYIERLRDPAHYPSLAKDRRLSILATQLHNVGMASSVLDGDAALRLADEIDGFGQQMYQGAALQVRLMVFMYRGQVELAQQCRARLDVLAVQGGAGTQFELWLAPYLADPHALWDDVIGLKQAAAHLRRVAAADPGYEPMASVALGHYHRARGDYGRALTVFERACALAPRDRHAGWLLALSGRIDTLVEAGEFAEAAALGDALLSSLNYGQRFSALVQQRLVRSMALARAQLGDITAAISACEDGIARELARGKSPLHLGRLHEARARIALLQGDEAGFAAQLGLVQRYFAETRNPLLLSRCERLAAAGRARHAPHGQSGAAIEGELDVAQVVSLMTGMETQQERARCALELIRREAGVEGGYLYLTRGEELEFITGRTEGAPEGLGALVTSVFHSLRQRHDTTETLAPESRSACDTMTLSCGARAFMPLPLGLTLHNKRAVFGMVVLSLDEPSLPTARQLRVVEAVARALYDVGDVLVGDAS